MLEKHGVSRMLVSFHDIIPGYVFGGLACATDYLHDNPEKVKAFLRGFMKSVRFIDVHEDMARAHIPKHTPADSATAMVSALREYTADGREDAILLEYQKDLMIEYGFLESDVIVDSIIDYQYLPDVKWLEKIIFKNRQKK